MAAWECWLLAEAEETGAKDEAEKDCDRNAYADCHPSVTFTPENQLLVFWRKRLRGAEHDHREEEKDGEREHVCGGLLAKRCAMIEDF